MGSHYMAVGCNRDLAACLTLIASYRRVVKNGLLTIVWQEDDPVPPMLLSAQGADVNFVHYHELTSARLTQTEFAVRGTMGWVLQQAVKLLYANVSAGNYVSLDAKDILLEDIATAGVCYMRKGWPIGEAQHSNYAHSAAFFGLTREDVLSIDNIVDTGTPFTVRKDTALGVMTHLCMTEGEKDFGRAFLKIRSRTVATEYLLYFFYVVAALRSPRWTLNDICKVRFPAWPQPIVKTWASTDLVRLTSETVRGAALIGFPTALRQELDGIRDADARQLIASMVSDAA